MGYVLMLFIHSLFFSPQTEVLANHSDIQSVQFLSDIQRQNWAMDSLGCMGLRNELLPTVKSQISTLSHFDIEANLGQPNFKSSNGDLFYYQVLSNCGDRIRPSNEDFLVITFDASGIVSEFAVNTVGG